MALAISLVLVSVDIYAAQNTSNWGKIHFKRFPGISEPVPFPDPELTPGELSSERSVNEICSPGFSTGQVRCARPAMKRDVALAYETDVTKPPCSAACEGDHWFPLEDLGIDPCEVVVPPSLSESRNPNDERTVGEKLAKSFWFQPGFKKPYTYQLPDGTTGHFGAHRKDIVEGIVARALCAHKIDASEIATVFANWPLVVLDYEARKIAKEPIEIDWKRYTQKDLGEYVEYEGGSWHKLEIR